MAQPILKHGLNKVGRDFIVGDVHGAFSMLRQAMVHARFNPAIDRLFCPGDLVDRGPDSAEALAWLGKPFFHPSRGNHDHDLATLPIAELRQLAAANWNGLGWLSRCDDETIDNIKRKLSELPFAMEIETGRGLVGVVHGEVPIGMPWGSFLAALEKFDEAAIQSAIWGRERIQSRDESGVAGIDRLFCGHSIQWGGPKKLGNVYFIDTGAVFRELGHDEGSICIANLACCSQTIANAPIQGPVTGFIEPKQGPFGSYAK